MPPKVSENHLVQNKAGTPPGGTWNATSGLRAMQLTSCDRNDFRYSYLPGTKPQITSLSLGNAAGFEVDVNHPTTVPVHCSRKGPVSGHYVPRRERVQPQALSLSHCAENGETKKQILCVTIVPRLGLSPLLVTIFY